MDLFQGIGSNWMTVIDTRSIGLTLPIFLWKRVMAQLNRIGPAGLDCTEAGDDHNVDPHFFSGQNLLKREGNSGWHRGADIASSSHVQNALTHCSFVKTLTNLTPLGPADGGTSHGPKSHLDAPYYILYGKSLLTYTKRRLNDSTAHG